MINKKFILGIILSIFLIEIISAVGEVSYCCEKTISGAWCQNAPQSECNTNFRKVPTSCESTSYCKLGCCYNSKEGTCMENTPQKVCDEYKGIWEDDAECDIPQCSLGCCLIGEQAAFVTQTRCKVLSSLYGLEISFFTNIKSEMECIASATSDVKGACVFEKDFEKTCSFLTKKECQEMGANSKESGVEFHEGYLCSADELGTNCGPRGGTTCVEGKDEVYFLDTCGNLANVYDFNKINNVAYWTYVAGYKDEVKVSCGLGLSNAGSTTCGNCDYYLGSTCKKGNAENGNYICKDLSCYEGNKKIAEHGETWCASVKGGKVIAGKEAINANLPGSRQFRLVCYNGEISIEPCADFRQEVCIQDTVNEFNTAGCRVNMWQDCYSNDNKDDCENRDRRDCEWIFGQSILKENETKYKDETEGACVPLYAPGFNFWNSEGDAESICSMASTECKVLYEKGIITMGFGSEEEEVVADEECEDECEDANGKNCEEKCKAKCVEKDNDGKWIINKTWKEEMNFLSKKLGDCGNSLNAFGIAGYPLKDIFQIKKVEEEEEE